ncbi:LysE family translocator [Silicimonas algicola]|uniref:Threonine/homoserine/homoserine lactone efflux protein n=1 Tax=Silicimonas algicola TaxID=1826607 RepID=A0A316GEF0_9RHOB|nr:LysE family translocator [Silicimonas algicola]AZQ66590.1 LysE family translocator [Silicimonas algicola]PWK58933.1 threonine/homoserine/homoserine lactone efflux protein [Silicimonas algicola]
MTYAHSLAIFWLLIFGIVVVPGMDMLLVLSQSLTRGVRGGLSAVAGIMAAGAVHTLWGAVSVAIVLSLPPAVLSAMLVAGALYLAWIGISLVRSAITVAAEDTRAAGGRAFRQGAVTALLNPKAYIFVASVFPQFVRPEYGALWRQGLVIGAMVAATQLAVYGGIAVAAGRIRGWLLGSPGATILTGRITGGLFLAVAALTLAGAISR